MITRVILSASLLFLVGGCLDSQPPAESEIVWGLGLPLEGQPLAGRGPFLEGTDNVTAFGRNIRSAFAWVFDDCQAPPDAMQGLDDGLKVENLHGTIESALESCSGGLQGLGSQSRELVASARANGTEEQVWLDLVAKARRAIANEAAMLSRLPAPGSVIDAELQSTLMGMNAFSGTALEGVGWLSWTYFRSHGNSSDDALSTAYLNALSPVQMERAMQVFVAHYPWTNGTCAAPDHEVLAAALTTQFHGILERALELEPPSEGAPINDIYGHVLKGELPDLEYYAKHGWWPAMLGEVKSATLYSAILDTHAHDHLPTREEAKYLLAQHQATNRTLDAEQLMQYFEYQLGTGVWGPQMEHEARKALALRHMQSGFLSLRCEAEPGNS